jgi:hypothetical protein
MMMRIWGEFGQLIVYLVLMVYIVGLMYWSDRREEKKFKEAVRTGKIRLISHAEYNRAFGIENKVRRVK